MKNSIGILIPTKNRQSLLTKALLSVFGQTVAPDEIIVVNDGSTDHTQEYLADLALKEPKLKVLNYPQSRGVNFARNQGIKIATTDWLIFLDDDDVLVPAAVALAQEKIKEIPDDYDAFYFNTLINKDGEQSVGGFQFQAGQKYYDPSYEDIMTKFGLKGDIKSVFRRSLFANPQYLFPESINGFESVTLRLVARDNKKSRYYPEISTIMNLDSDFEHLSVSVAAKDPRAYMFIHMQDLRDHKEFFRLHPELLRVKYIVIVRLAFRAHFYHYMFLYFFLSLLMRFGIKIFP